MVGTRRLLMKKNKTNKVAARAALSLCPFNLVKAEFAVRTQSTVAKTSQNILKLFDKLKILYPDVDHSQVSLC
ncbi:unnamed protein product [Didymodactylos carnosus]|uniref:Uncharacterized protein n=1 Tax=Didymodactylos carnosus TaxID=1234261 RepID=A0A814QKK1_9BILA|nr:unnamed protein product [Didymodactylos carnosus]CAF1256774.1 unnamed protein product [Didymodactylos carnosus]CAF3884491.1 unnamed protein product [Didymodactylos carnosus]CAF4063686.1 unnamed protein product [Didymodactylos carnosus]